VNTSTQTNGNGQSLGDKVAEKAALGAALESATTTFFCLLVSFSGAKTRLTQEEKTRP
jgi:hypothetical protein